MKIATVFGASKAPSKELYNSGVELGNFLASRGFIIKCGGYGGLMEAVSKGARERNQEVIGVGLESFNRYRLFNPYITKKIVAKDLFERLKILIENSSIYIAQEGSVGTLNEIFMVLALLKGNLLDKIPLILIGKEYINMRSCSFLDRDFFENSFIYESVDQFKEAFDKDEFNIKY
ncbi:MAG: LOG family protein [Epsilonproteobacteria bacterium]|nr:LOG family protein [Campylobacterota bacterium]